MFSPCNCFIASAMIKNNQIRVRSFDSFDTNWRGLLNTRAAVLDFGGRSLREEEEDEEDVGTGSAQCPWSALGQLREDLCPCPHISHPSARAPNGKWKYFCNCLGDVWLCAAQRVREHRRGHGICLEDIYHLLEWKNSGWEVRWWPPQSNVEPNEKKYFQKKNNNCLRLPAKPQHNIFHISMHKVSHWVCSSARKIHHKWHHSGYVSLLKDSPGVLNTLPRLHPLKPWQLPWQTWKEMLQNPER